MDRFSDNHWGYRVLFYTRAVWVGIHLMIIGYLYGGGESGALLLAIGVIVGIVPQWIWFRGAKLPSWVYPIAELLMSGCFFIYSSAVMNEYFSYLAIPAMCAAAKVHTARLRIPLWFWFSIMPGFAMALVMPLSSFNLSVIEGFFFFGLGCIVWKVMDTQRRMQLLLNENERQRLVLEQYAKQVESITLLEERNRLARELHDTVGHTLTSVIMGLDAIGYLQKEDPEEALRSIKQLRKAAGDGLEEVRNQIHHISPAQEEGDSISVQIRNVAEQFAFSTGTSIQFESEGQDLTVPLPVAVTLIRCVQESLTNATRHGKASSIRIALSLQTEQVGLSIVDDGCGMEEVQYGFGLTKMQERVNEQQGELTIVSVKNSGTTVTCQLPIHNRKAG